MRKTAILLLLSVTLGAAIPASAAIPSKLITETIELAAKKSGRTLTPAVRESSGKALEKAAARYGENALKAVRTGGIETIEQGAKHGDDFWRLCAEVPEGARSLALNADTLMPLAKRIGPDVLRFEAKAPGLALRTAQTFGDDAVKALAKAPPQDITRLLGYAAKSDSKATEKLLYETYGKSKSPSVFLDHLNWKHIMSTGLSAAAITAAYKVSNGVESGLEETAKNNPEVFAKMVNDLSMPFKILIILGGLLLLYPLARLSLKTGNRLGKEKKTGDKE